MRCYGLSTFLHVITIKKKESWIEEVECDAMGGENVVSISQCYVYVCMSIDELKRT